MRLNAFTLVDGTEITEEMVASTLVGPGLAFTLEPGTENEENITATNMNRNDDGSVDFTIVRGGQFAPAYGNQGSLQNSHGTGSVVVLSNTAQFYDRSLINYIDRVQQTGAISAGTEEVGMMELADSSEINGEASLGDDGPLGVFSDGLFQSKYQENLPSDDSKTYLDNVTGSVEIWGGNGNLPDGWLLADGREVSRTEYADLFAVIGTDYGSGDGSTTFNLPDYVGKSPLSQYEKFFNSYAQQSDVEGNFGGDPSYIVVDIDIELDSFISTPWGTGALFQTEEDTQNSLFEWSFQEGEIPLGEKTRISFGLKPNSNVSGSDPRIDIELDTSSGRIDFVIDIDTNTLYVSPNSINGPQDYDQATVVPTSGANINNDFFKYVIETENGETSVEVFDASNNSVGSVENLDFGLGGEFTEYVLSYRVEGGSMGNNTHLFTIDDFVIQSLMGNRYEYIIKT